MAAFEDFCRSCLRQGGSFESIFKVKEGLDTRSMAEIINISISSSVHINENDGYSNKICVYCSDTILAFHKFVLNIESNQEILKSSMINIEENEHLLKENMFFDSSILADKKEVDSIKAEILDPTCESNNDYEVIQEKKYIKQEETNFEEEVQEYGTIEETTENDDISEGNSHQQKIKFEFVLCNETPHNEIGVNTQTECKTLTRKENLKQHSNKKVFQCEVCDKSFIKKSYLVAHLLIHSGKKLFECEQCFKTFLQKGHLQSHLLTHGEKHFDCNHCGKLFRRKSNLQSHLLTHSGRKLFECEMCDKTFARKSNLETHLLIHSGKKEFECEQCHKKFTLKRNLQTHLIIHSGKKPFKCEQCHKSFTQKSNLETHLLIHSGKKAFQCEHCLKRFTLKSNLITHLLTHSGIKAFECEDCHKTFTHKSTLATHFLTHSGKKSLERTVQ